MEILHLGNIANNAYNNAKFLRRKGWQSDVLCYDYTHVMGQPEWEDAEFEGEVDEFHPNWEGKKLGGFHRPTWFKQAFLYGSPRRRRKWFKGQFRLERLMQYPWTLVHAWPTYREARAHVSCIGIKEVLATCVNETAFRKWFEGYDLIQAYATEPIHAWLFGNGCPYVAYEHGTMRDIPFENSSRGRLLTVAYKRAGKIIITNPDVIAAAQRLRLSQYQFVPHPVDETKYRPCPTPLRNQLRHDHQADLILFAPSRHNWGLKGNDCLIRAFARYAKSCAQKAVLIFTRWGQEVDRSEQLVNELGLNSRVVWTAPLNKRKLIHYYNASDIVLDQFTIGTFGTVTPEAMACGKPVILCFNREVHEWCYPEMPPVVNARSEDDIFQRLHELGADACHRKQLGTASRAWIIKHHGWELVADRQIAIYRELLQQ